jgi:hypothetical protein
MFAAFLTRYFAFWIFYIWFVQVLKLNWNTNFIQEFLGNNICVKCYMKHFVKGGNHVFNIMTPDFPFTSENETKCTILYKKFSNFKWQDFSLFKNFEENLYISHTMHYKSWRFKCFIFWKLVWWPIFVN